MRDKQTILQGIMQQGMLPLYYHDDADVCRQVAQALYKAGIRAIEFTNRGGAALENFKVLKAAAQTEMPGLALGIGTVKWEAEAKAFIDAGADFVVAPIINPQVAEVVNQAGLLFVPGCMTPTEIAVAQQYNALLIKLFPGSLLKPDFVNAVKELFPGQLFMPTGGIELNKENLTAWFKAGVCAVGIGSRLISKAVLQQSLYDDLYKNTVAALAMVREAKNAAG